MKLLARLALLACLLLVGGVGVHARGPLESSLQEAGGNRPDLLYVVLFSLPDCPIAWR
jgi:hypothetical protein